MKLLYSLNQIKYLQVKSAIMMTMTVDGAKCLWSLRSVSSTCSSHCCLASSLSPGPQSLPLSLWRSEDLIQWRIRCMRRWHFQEKSGLTVRSSGAEQETCQWRQSSHLLHLLLQWSRVLWRIFLESKVLDLIQNSYLVTSRTIFVIWFHWPT